MSLFDSINKQLDPHLFNEQDQMKPFPRQYLLEYLSQYMPEGAVSKMVVIGSIVGYKYSETSDIDLTVILKPKFKKKDLWPTIKKINGHVLPGSQHPINYFLQNYNPGDFEDAKFGVYDVLKNKWIVRSDQQDFQRPSGQQYRDELRYAKLYASVIDDLIQDMVQLQKKTVHPEIVEKKKKEIKEVLENVENQRKMVYRSGWGVPRESFQNILYKFIEHQPRFKGLSYDPEDKPIKWKQILNQFLD